MTAKVLSVLLVLLGALLGPGCGSGLAGDEKVWFVQALRRHGPAAPCGEVEPVVVVGTDGSGTRAVAKFLALTNVSMLVERAVYSQMDVDGTSAGVHFTRTIQAVLNHTHSPAFALPALPPPLAAHTLDVLRPFALSMRQNACEAVHVHHTTAWGFKKPDLLNLGPFVDRLLEGVKIVHVVRDGRDMAFSKNGAALHKYANALFPPDHPASAPFLGRSAEEQKLLLWLKQNLDFARWADARLGSHRYHRIRIEDVAGAPGNDAVAFRAFRALASFAGAPPVDDAAVTRAARQLQSHSLGSHDTSAAHKSVRSQFGKWRALASPALQAELTRMAKEALDAFGYSEEGAAADGRRPRERRLQRRRRRRRH